VTLPKPDGGRNGCGYRQSTRLSNKALALPCWKAIFDGDFMLWLPPGPTGPQAIIIIRLPAHCVVDMDLFQGFDTHGP